MNSRLGIILALLLALAIMTLCAAAGWSRANAQIPLDDCKPVAWDKTKLTITWQSAPWNGMDYHAVFTLTSNTGYQFISGSDDWYRSGGNVYMTAVSDFHGYTWQMSGLYCVAHYSDGSSAWSQPNPYAYIGDFIQRMIGSVLTRVQK